MLFHAIDDRLQHKTSIHELFCCIPNMNLNHDFETFTPYSYGFVCSFRAFQNVFFRFHKNMSTRCNFQMRSPYKAGAKSQNFPSTLMLKWLADGGSPPSMTRQTSLIAIEKLI